MGFKSSFRGGNKRRLMSDINVVPYIDVTLILLIIFMITAPIVQQAVTVELPQTPTIDQPDNKKSTTDQAKPFVITVTEQGYYKTSENPQKVISAEDIKLVVAEVVARSQLKKDQQFYIQGDRKTPYQNVMHLFVLLKANGVEQVSLLTEPENP